ncbi:NAD(P)H-binding protein [Deefgea piscis]|uniref:NAD(P)H-binding protein n=1 Tax=Deefgea piscis TaxID=2739061 RepID=UPI001C7F320E|nr:NAD(P)H-binding protein [Deefgea piscis]QZA82071.1 NAD(P)H-binding protein [Deefgea piscis]
MTQHDLLIFGGAANTGLHLVHHARSQGLRVACMVRAGRDTSALTAAGVTILQGDAFNVNDCQNAIAAAAAPLLISLLGGKNAEGRRVDDIGNINAIDAAQQVSHPCRFVLLTSLGCDEQWSRLSPAAHAALGQALQAKTRAEQHLRHTQLDWLIVRPGGLTHQAATGQYVIEDDTTAAQDSCDYLPRADAAQALLALALCSDNSRKTITVLGKK